MRSFLLALPLASLLLLAGCTESDSQASGFGSSSSAKTTAAAPAKQQPAAPAVQPAQPAMTTTMRRSTTQPLPAGYGYLHEQDLAPAANTTATAPSNAQQGGI